MGNIRDERFQYGMHWRLQEIDKEIEALKEEKQKIMKTLGIKNGNGP